MKFNKDSDMKRKNILNKFDLVVYPLSICVAIDCSDDYLNSELKETIIPLGNNLVAHVCFVEYGILIRFRNISCMTVQIISHEATHAALYVFDYIYRGVLYKENTGENERITL